MLLEYANSYELNSGNGLSGFIRYIDSVMESKGDFRSGNVSASSQNAVYIKTMHKSKGLEFPFVFIAETSTKFSIQAVSYTHLDVYKRQLIYRSMNLKDKLSDMTEEEQLRLLATDGMLVKRPILIGDDTVLVGFKEAEWETIK